jgi:predicted dehydrogenase
VLQAPPQLPVNISIVGCGQIARLHVQRLLADNRARVAAVVDPDQAAAERLRSDLAPNALCFASVEALLESGACQAAVVCTPTHLHDEQVRQLRSAGLAVLCEKPLADSLESTVRLARSACDGPLLSIAYQRRHWATFRRLRQEIGSRRHGPVRSLHVQSEERWQPAIAGTWRDDPARNPWGFLGDAGSHKVDMAFYLTGLLPVEVFAVSDKRGSAVDIATSLVAHLQNDALLTMNFVGDAHHYREDFSIHCAEADLLLRDGRLAVARNNTVTPIENLEEESDPDRAFLDCLVGGKPNLAPAEIAIPVWLFTHAALESARLGRPVQVPRFEAAPG